LTPVGPPRTNVIVSGCCQSVTAALKARSDLLKTARSYLGKCETLIEPEGDQYVAEGSLRQIVFRNFTSSQFCTSVHIHQEEVS